MGVNIFVEGRPLPVIVTVKLPRDINNFKNLKDVSDALVMIEKVLETDWPQQWPTFDLRPYGRARLLRFVVSSPPIFQVFTDPAWLAVFVMVLIGYKDLKESSREISNDLSSVLSTIRGLTEREVELLAIAVRLSLAKVFERAGKNADKLARRFRRISQKLLGEEGKPPEINVTSIRPDKT